jgi:pyruvate dehydrogenase E2 component (dihydrolipoamide acetyltransferase)
MDVRLPPMSATMREGTVLRWLHAEGDVVAAGEPLLEVETDKAVMTVESPYPGRISRVLVAAGETVPVGTPLAEIAEEGGPQEVAPDDPGRASSPAARRRARELGVDLSLVPGTGPGGRVTSEDVERYAAAGRGGEAKKGNEEEGRGASRAPLSPMRQEIARAVAVSQREIPAFWVTDWVDLQEVEALRAVLNRSLPREEQVTLTDFLLQALADSLLQVPDVCRRLVEEGDGLAVEPLPADQVGLVVATGDGLLVPTVTGLTTATVFDVARRRRQVVEAAEAGRLTGEALRPAAISLSNLGKEGVRAFMALIQPGQSAVLAVGSLQQEARVVAGSIVVATGCHLTLTVDHRLIDGRLAARFLRTLVARIEVGRWRLR